jgi:hypothetical protein
VCSGPCCRDNSHHIQGQLATTGCPGCRSSGGRRRVRSHIRASILPRPASRVRPLRAAAGFVEGTGASPTPAQQRSRGASPLHYSAPTPQPPTDKPLRRRGAGVRVESRGVGERGPHGEEPQAIARREPGRARAIAHRRHQDFEQATQAQPVQAPRRWPQSTTRGAFRCKRCLTASHAGAHFPAHLPSASNVHHRIRRRQSAAHSSPPPRTCSHPLHCVAHPPGVRLHSLLQAKRRRCSTPDARRVGGTVCPPHRPSHASPSRFTRPREHSALHVGTVKRL